MIHIIHNNFNLRRAEEPYASNQEYLQEWIKFLEIKIYFYLHHVLRITETRESKLDKYKGLVIGREEIIGLLEEIEREKEAGHTEEFSHQEEQEYFEVLPLLEDYFEQRKIVTLNNGVFLPFGYLIHIFQLNNFEQHCLILSLLNNLDRKYEKIFGYLQDDVTMKNPTSDLAIKLFSPEETGIKIMDFLHILEHKLFKYFFLDHSSQSQNTLSRPLLLDKRMMDFIFDFQGGGERADKFISVHYPGEDIPKLIVQNQVQEDMGKMLEKQEDNILIFCHGAWGSGKKLHIRTLGNRLKRPVVFVDCRAILKSDFKLDMVNLNKTIREVLLHDSFLCLTNFENFESDPQGQGRLEEAVLDLLEEIGSQVDTLFITSWHKWHLRKKISGYNWFDLEIALPHRVERSIVWENIVGKKELSQEIDLNELANKFHFTPGQIVNGLAEARQRARWQGKEQITSKILYDACYKQISHSLHKKASLVYASFRMEDLVLPREQKQHIINACNHVKYRHVVLDQWGFEDKLPYGKGVSMLLGGPPGTGKTMAAQVVAHELGLEMYKIDLSQVVSKYIGETEKSLKEVFDEAEKSSAIIFLDECDSILGKRTDVKDAHDRYANIETSFLLQKIEEFEGVSILATNYLTNIDAAFLRRINYVIHFPFPNQALREKIWQSIFPEKTPVSRDVDYKFLAKQFEMTGGTIKNIAVNAAFLAAAARKEVSMKYVVLALRDEMTKQGKSVVIDDFGEYGYLLK